MEERQHPACSSAARALPRPDELLALARQRFDSASGRLVQALKANTREHGARLNRVAPRLSLAPLRAVIANERRSLDLSGQRAAQALARLVAFQRQRFEGVAKLATRCPTSPCCGAASRWCGTRRASPSIAAATSKQWQALTSNSPMAK